MVSVTGQNHDAFRFNGSKRASYVLEKICGFSKNVLVQEIQASTE